MSFSRKNDFSLIYSSSTSFLASLILALNLISRSNGAIGLNLQNQSCATVTTSFGQKIELFENGILDREEYESIRNGKMTNALFQVAQSPGRCILEICGFTWPPRQPYYESVGSCEWYSGGETRASDLDFNENSDVSSMSCACSAAVQKQCRMETCSSRNPRWPTSQCALLYQERNCQSCVFNPITLSYGEEFLSLNSFQIKSAIVRPGCRVRKATKGAIYADSDRIYEREYMGLNNVTEPVYHKDSENFTCKCDDSVIVDMREARSTPLESTLMDEEPGNNDEDDLHSTENEQNHESHFLGISEFQNLLPIIGFILLATVGASTGLKIIGNKRGNDGHCAEFSLKSVKNANDKVDENFEMIHNDPEVIVETPIITNKINQVPTGHQIMPTTVMMEQLKSYVELLFESSRREEELNVPSVNKVGTTVTNYDADIAADQFHLICEPQFIIRRKEFVIHEQQLGSGQFGVVYTGTLKREGDGLLENVAIKRLKWLRSQEKVINSFLREVKIFQFVAINHANIVRFHGACYHNGEFYILTQLCENGSLETYLKTVMRETISKQRKESEEAVQETCGYLIVDGDDDGNESGRELPPPLTLQTAELCQLLHWSEQIANGMEYLHRMKIIHLDLAARNVLLSTDLTAKIADLGLSRKCSDGKDYAESVLKGLFPPNSFAPECIAENVEDAMRMTVFVDIWAFGCTIWEIFSLGEDPYPNMTFVGVAKFLKEGGRLAQPELAPTFVYEKLLECWDEVPQQRPSFQELRIFFEEKRNTMHSTHHSSEDF